MWNSAAVAKWKAQSAAYVGRRDRRLLSRNGAARSNAALIQLAAYGTQGKSSNGPTSGQSALAASQMRRGMARRSQSPCSLAAPAKKYTSATCARSTKSIHAGPVADRARASQESSLAAGNHSSKELTRETK